VGRWLDSESLAIELAFRAADGGNLRVVLPGDRGFREEAGSARAIGRRSKKPCSIGWAITSQSVEMPGHCRRGRGEGRVAGAVTRSRSCFRRALRVGWLGGRIVEDGTAELHALAARPSSMVSPFERRIASLAVSGCPMPGLWRVIGLLASVPGCAGRGTARGQAAERSPEPVVDQRTGGRVRLAAAETLGQRWCRTRSSPGGGSSGER